MKNWMRFAGVLLILTVAIAACSGPGSAEPKGINEGNRAPDFTLQALDGDRVSLSQYRGSVVLVNFWATWCPPCRAEIPGLEAAYQAHKDEGFVVLGISVDEPQSTVEPFAADMGITYPVLLDEGGKIMNAYRTLGLPMSLLVDRDGVIQVRHTGLLTAAQLEDYLAKVLPNR